MLMASVLVSCHGKDHESAIRQEKWAEVFFEERLASISSDPDNEHFYIGTEDGGVYFGSKEGFVRYNTPFNRIYCVKRDEKNQNHYWVGARNMGLFYCRLSGDSLVKVKSYIIPDKIDRFSVYDICFTDDDSLYLGTSNGLFRTSAAVDTKPAFNIKLEEIWYKGKLGDPVLVNKVCNDRDSIYFTVPNAIMKYSNGHIEILDSISNKTNIKVQPSLYKETNGTVMAMMSDSVYYNINGSPTPLNHSCFCFVYANNNVYQITKDYLYITCNGTSLPGLLLPSQARQECRNVMINDSRDQVLLVTSHHLIRIPHHIMPPTYAGSDVRVSASCVDKETNTAYYFVGDTLYELKSGETAHEKFILDSTKHSPSFLTTCKGKFYYVFNNRLFCINDKGSYEKEYPLPQEPTAIESDNGSIYIGVRDELLALKDTTLTVIELKYGKNSFVSHPFITAFCPRKKDDNLYIATLNDGVFKGKNGDFQRDTLLSNDITHRFIRDIAVIGNSFRDTVLVLTHRGLWVHPNGEEGKFIKSPGYNRLLVNGSQVVAVADFGLRKFRFNFNHSDPDSIISFSDLYEDWGFVPELSLFRVEGLLVCRNNRVLAFNNLTSDPTQDAPRGIEFEQKLRLSRDLSLMLLCIGIAAVLFLLMYLKYKKDRSAQDKEFNKQLSHIKEVNAKTLQDKQEVIGKIEVLTQQLKELESLRLPNYASIKERADKAISSVDLQSIENEINYLTNLKKVVDISTDFKKEYNSRETKILAMMSDQSLRKQSILVMLDRLMKSDGQDPTMISEYETFACSSLDADEIAKVLANIVDEAQKTLTDDKSDFAQAANDVLNAQADKVNKVKIKIKTNPAAMGWKAIDDLFDEVYSLKIRHEMANGFIHLNALINSDLKAKIEELREKKDMIKSIKEKAKEWDSILRKEGKQFNRQAFIEQCKLLTEEEKELITSCDEEILNPITNAIHSIYRPWAKGVPVDGELKQQISKSKKGFLNTQEDVIVTLHFSGSIEQWDGLLDAFSILYLFNNDMKGNTNSIISRFNGRGSTIPDKIKNYAKNRPDSIARFFYDKKSDSQPNE